MNKQREITEEDIKKIKYLCNDTKIFVSMYRGYISIKKGKVIKESTGEELHNPDWNLILQSLKYQSGLQGKNMQMKQPKKEPQKEDQPQDLIGKAKQFFRKVLKIS